jgi:hypothetical protein
VHEEEKACLGRRRFRSTTGVCDCRRRIKLKRVTRRDGSGMRESGQRRARGRQCGLLGAAASFVEIGTGAAFSFDRAGGRDEPGTRVAPLCCVQLAERRRMADVLRWIPVRPHVARLHFSYGGLEDRQFSADVLRRTADRRSERMGSPAARVRPGKVRIGSSGAKAPFFLDPNVGAKACLPTGRLQPPKRRVFFNSVSASACKSPMRMNRKALKTRRMTLARGAGQFEIWPGGHYKTGLAS